MSSSETQVVVIGAGPGGYAAAFQAADMGMQVTMVDASPQLGGVCLNTGCIPSKALLHVARLIGETRESAQWGIEFAPPKIDLDKLRGWKDGIVSKLGGGVRQLARGRKVEVKTAFASFIDSQTLELAPIDGGKKETLRFRHAIVAAGSVPTIPPIFALDDPRVMDSTGALELADIPGSLLIVGGGIIGLEMGCAYAGLGSKVTCVELTSGLIPGVDRDLVRPLEKRLRSEFEAIYLDTKVVSLKAKPKGIVAALEGKDAPKSITFDRVLVAIGRRPSSGKLGLENTQVKLDERGFIVVDRQMRTADPHIFAIGDIVGEPMLAHKASREAKVAAEVIAGKKSAFDNATIPGVVYTDPEIAWCGITETEAKAEGIAVKVGKFPWSASGRAMTQGRAEGLTKIIFDPETERVLGVGIVGSHAGDLIAEGVLAVEMAAVAHDLAETIHAHPTLSETLMESAEAFLGVSTHIQRK